MFSKKIIFFVFALPLLYSFTNKKVDLKERITNSCSDIPVKYYLQDRQISIDSKNSLYRFGQDDAGFRIEINKILDRYIENGTPLKPSEQNILANKYLPNFMSSCIKYLEEYASDCGQFEIESKQYKLCTEKYDNEFNELLRVYYLQRLKKESLENKDQKNMVIDIDKLNFEDLRKEYRKLQIDGANYFLK
jgi:hypothetical protein